MALHHLFVTKAKYKYYFNIKLLIVPDVFMFCNTKTPDKLHLTVLAF